MKAQSRCDIVFRGIPVIYSMKCNWQGPEKKGIGLITGMKKMFYCYINSVR